MEQIVFLNIAWMNFYQGIKGGDEIKGNFGYLKDHKSGHEIFNFLAYKGKMYGYAPVRININKLGAKTGDDKIRNVTVVWVSNNVDGGGGVFVVGWYRNATIFRDCRPNPVRRVDGRPCEYNVITDARNYKLLNVDERIHRVPTKRGGLGETAVWYAQSPRGKRFANQVRKMIHGDGTPPLPARKPCAKRPRQPDIDKRLKVEKTAMLITENHYSKLGYKITRRYLDAAGWDIEARKHNQVIFVEIKGLSGKDICVEVTPNEFRKMNDKEHRSNYRISVVTEALSRKPVHSIFAFSPEQGRWKKLDGTTTLSVQKIESARLQETK